MMLQSMNLRLAEASTKYGGLLSPDFFLQSPDTSPTISSRDGMPPSACIVSTLPGIIVSTTNQRIETPFTSPEVTVNSEGNDEKNSPIVTDNRITNLEKIEILDENHEEVDESEWMKWPKAFIEQKGFCLGIQPGNLYKNQSLPCFYVKLPHRSNYEILVTNRNHVPCDLDIYVNGQITNALRLPADSTKSVNGPSYSKYAFKIFRSKDSPKGCNVSEGSRQNGVVKAVFTPKKIEDSRYRAFSEPLRIQQRVPDIWDILNDSKEVRQRSYTTNDEANVERSLDMSEVAEGVTLLQGKKKRKYYAPAPEMETDISKRVILQLRLIASLVEEVEATEGDVRPLEPPPLSP